MTKEALRERVWTDMESSNVARFPRPAHGRIPNFFGAEKAAAVLAATDTWREARVIKCNPDSAQQPVREQALREGKTLYMAVPKLKTAEPFVRVRGEEATRVKYASTIRGALGYGRAVGIDEMEEIEMVVTGSVAVNHEGARLGKGGGFGDLEFALARAYGKITAKTPVVTTVHPTQVLREEIPMETHDEPVDYIATTAEFLQTAGKFPKPSGIHWDLLTTKQIAAIPILKRIQAQ